jgi:phosphomannomutase/phosphoglucomutase
VVEELLMRFDGMRVDTTDGIKVYFDEGWALIRPSGTEPIFRIYSEARSDQAAKRIGDECEKALKEVVKECEGD